MPVRILTEVRSGGQERKLHVFLSDWLEPPFTAFVGSVQEPRDSGSNTITKEENLLFNRISGFPNIQVNLRAIRLHRDKGQICHTDDDIEIQGIDGRQSANPKVLKIEYCFLASEVFLNSPS